MLLSYSGFVLNLEKQFEKGKVGRSLRLLIFTVVIKSVFKFTFTFNTLIIPILSRQIVTHVEYEYFRRFRLGAKNDCHVHRWSVCLSALMYQRDSHWKDFHKIWYQKLLRISGMKVEILLKSGKNQKFYMKA